jgi:hypothetical protein
MVTQWEKDRKHIMTGLGAHGWTGRISWLLGVIFAIIGVIGEAASIDVGLESGSWYLLSIAAFASSIGNIVAWVGGLYLYAKEEK